MTVFFDIDDTLHDRSLPFTAAMHELLGNPNVDARKVYLRCTERGNEVFHASQRGEITMDEMYIYRWGKGFADVGIHISDEEALTFQKLYRANQDKIVLTPVLAQMLSYCAEHADGVGVITNGPTDVQWNKVNRLGLERFIRRDRIIVSGDIGIDKPDLGIFRHAETISGAKPENLLYVGDSLKHDVYPASKCGWQTIWFNRDGLPTPDDLHPTAIVKTEAELGKAIREMII